MTVSVANILKPYHDLLVELCRQYRVAQLYLFGSAVTDKFDLKRSDLDFLVQFVQRTPTMEYANQVFGFNDALEALFGRPVDLITVESLKKPGFKSIVESTRELIYDASRQSTTN